MLVLGRTESGHVRGRVCDLVVVDILLINVASGVVVAYQLPASIQFKINV